MGNRSRASHLDGGQNKREAHGSCDRNTVFKRFRQGEVKLNEKYCMGFQARQREYIHARVVQMKVGKRPGGATVGREWGRFVGFGTEDWMRAFRRPCVGKWGCRRSDDVGEGPGGMWRPMGPTPARRGDRPTRSCKLVPVLEPVDPGSSR